MRTTVTLDPDVERLLRKAMEQTQQSFKVTLNQAIRRGLASLQVGLDEERFVVLPKDMGLRPGIDPSKLNEVVDEMDVEAHLGLTQQLRPGQAESPS